MKNYSYDKNIRNGKLSVYIMICLLFCTDKTDKNFITEVDVITVGKQ